MKKLKHFLLIYFLIIFISACSKVGALISNTGDFVSKTGEIIGGRSTDKPEPIGARNSRKPKQAKFPIVANTKKRPFRQASGGTKLSRLNTVLIRINTTQTVNPSASGKPSRIKITVLQLKAASKFISSRISTLQSDLKSTLSVDLISEESISLLPKKEKTLKLVLDPSTRVLGIFGSFKQLNNTIWKTTINLPKVNNKSYSVHVLVDSKRISARKK